jgi:glycerol-3-phosphate acyltransferase PlsY
MEWVWFLLLCIAAFFLGSCPFAIWIGKFILHKDIRQYGDHNPGAANVFKAGSIAWGFLAVFLEILKGMPFVLMAVFLGLAEPLVYSIALCAVAGHAWSPILKFRGGKASAVTLGVLLAIPDKDIAIVLLLLAVAGFFFLDSDGWRATLAVAGCLLFAAATDKSVWLLPFLTILLIIIAVKNGEALRSLPKSKDRIYIGFGQK